MTFAAADRPAGSTGDDAALVGLLARVAGGDRAAFAALYDRLAPLVYGIANQLVLDPVAADRVTQQTFVELWRQAPRFHNVEGKVRAWAGLIAQRCGLDPTAVVNGADDQPLDRRGTDRR